MLTDVELLFLPGRVERWVRFGRPAAERVVDRHRRVLSFSPGAVFALMRWEGGAFGTVASRLDILRTVAPGMPFTLVPFVAPGGELLLRLHGWPRVQRALQAIDTVETVGVSPENAAPDYWRHVGNRILAGLEPRAYDAARHRAWRFRQALQ